jgi:hypothetical protein
MPMIAKSMILMAFFSMPTIPFLMREDHFHVDCANVEPLLQRAIVVVFGRHLPNCAPLAGPMFIQAVVVYLQHNLLEKMGKIETLYFGIIYKIYFNVALLFGCARHLE